MQRAIAVMCFCAALATLLWAQQNRATDRDPALPPYELRSVFPRETAPAQFQQVEQRELQVLANDGWELVSVMPYVYRNEERGSSELHPRPMVTQTYPAYFFKRLKMERRIPARTPAPQLPN
jgi:hypothetical protein